MAFTTINYNSPFSVNIGDVFYRVEVDGSEWFKSPCPVCEGTGSLTVNGYNFKCPCCDQQEKAFSVHNYVVKKYKVFCISQECRTDTWKTPSERRTSFELFRKTDRSMYATATKRFFDSDLSAADPSIENIVQYPGRLDRTIYTDYRLAKETAQVLNNKEKEALGEYNASHGTSFDFPEFATKDDKKESGHS